MYLETEKIKHVKTSTYNPTGNGISERINQTTTRVLQVSEPTTIEKIMRKTNIVLQNQPHRSLNASPYEVCKRRSQFDPQQRTLSGFTQKHISRAREVAEATQSRLNKGRTPHTYRIGEIVFKEAQVRKTKYDPYWEGPYTITEISPYQTRCTLENSSRVIQTNTKTIRPTKRGQDVGPGVTFLV